MPQGQKSEYKQQNQYCNKFNKDFKNGPHQKSNLKKKLNPLFLFLSYSLYNYTKY